LLEIQPNKLYWYWVGSILNDNSVKSVKKIQNRANLRALMADPTK
jgi:hypothetical protein